MTELALERTPRLQLDRAVRGARRFLGASWLNVIGVTLVLAVLFVAVFGGMLAPSDTNQLHLLDRLEAPSKAHLFGTDDLGRDIFSRVLAGARISIEVAALILSISITVGTLLGTISALAGGLVDELVMRATDLFLAFPALILAAAIAATLGPSLSHTILALSTVYWPWYARLTRGQVLSLREREFVLAARVAGAGTISIVFRHMLRNVLPLVVVQASLDVGYAILFTSSLSFLGLGAQPPTPEWGAMMTDGRNFLQDAWWYPTFPGLALALTVLGFNLFGDGLRDWLDPRLRGKLRRA
ncbi:MAG TPA: nickel transporter permease [Gaiellaceae bacterium]|jgi:peptide/nickel transport system permease protein|nr:nickel transporter permease [Gaiellaceae bacterium]